MAGGTAPNNRVSTQTFYEALLKQNDRMDDMERRIMGELKGLPTRVETNSDEIKTLRKRSNLNDIVVLVVGVVVSAITTAIGNK